MLMLAATLTLLSLTHTLMLMPALHGMIPSTTVPISQPKSNFLPRL